MCVFSAQNANFCIKMWFNFNPTFPLFMKVCAPTNQGTREEKFCPRAFQSYFFIAPRRYLEKDIIVIRQISTVCLTHFSPSYSLSGTMKSHPKRRKRPSNKSAKIKQGQFKKRSHTSQFEIWRTNIHL